jgi:hypothetical protein
MKRARKSPGFPSLPGFPTVLDEPVRAQAGARARACARTDRDRGGEGGEGGEPSLDLESTPAVSPPPVAKNDRGTPGEPPPHRATPPVPETGSPIDEVRALRVAHLPELPIPTTLVLACGTLLSTSRPRVEEARASRQVVFAPLEFQLAAFALEEGAATRADWQRWIAEKRSDSTWRLVPEHALERTPGLATRWSTWLRELARGDGPVAPITRLSWDAFLGAAGVELADVVLEA